VYSTWAVPPEFLFAMIHAAAGEGAVLRVVEAPAERRAVSRLIERAAVEQDRSPDAAGETGAWTGRSRGAREGVPAANAPVHDDGAVPNRRFAEAEQAQHELGRGRATAPCWPCWPRPPTNRETSCAPARRSARCC
jgi:hypothetical protein